METPKILITVKDGIIQSIAATQSIEYVIVDLDNEEDNEVSEVLENDYTCKSGQFHNMFAKDNDSQIERVFYALGDMKF